MPDTVRHLICKVTASALLALTAPVGALDEPPADDKAQLEKFAGPLYVELTNAGLPPQTAQKEANRLMMGLQRCWASELNVVDSDEQEVQMVQLGEETIVTYKSPCLDAFLRAVDETVPGRRDR